MSLRYPRFYLFGGRHYYGHIRLPRLCLTYTPLGDPTFMCYLRYTRNNILLRTVPLVTPFKDLLSVFLIQRGYRFKHIRKLDHCLFRVTKPYCCSLCIRSLRALMYSFPPTLSQWLQPERQIGLIVTFIQLGI